MSDLTSGTRLNVAHWHESLRFIGTTSCVLLSWFPPGCFCKLCAQGAAHWVTWECESREPWALLGNATIFPNQTNRLGSIISPCVCVGSDHVNVQGRGVCKKKKRGKKEKEIQHRGLEDRERMCLKTKLMCTLKVACVWSSECLLLVQSRSVQDTKRNLVRAEHRR